MKSIIIALSILGILAGCGSEERYLAQPKSTQPKAMPAPPPPAPIQSKSAKIAKENWPNKSLESKTDNLLSQMVTDANLVFKIPDSVELNNRIRAQLLVDLEKSIEDLQEANTAKGTPITGSVKLSRVITARLIAPDFEVTAIEPEEQALIAGQTATWNWSLLPKASGTYDVTLTIDAKVEVNNREKTAHIRTFERTVKVTVTPTQVIFSFINENWQWLWSALLVPLFLWFWKSNKRS